MVRLPRTFNLPAYANCPEQKFLWILPQTSLSIQALLALVSVTRLGVQNNLPSWLKVSLCSRRVCVLRGNAARGKKKKSFRSKSRVVDRILDQEPEDVVLGLTS